DVSLSDNGVEISGDTSIAGKLGVTEVATVGAVVAKKCQAGNIVAETSTVLTLECATLNVDVDAHVGGELKASRILGEVIVGQLSSGEELRLEGHVSVPGSLSAAEISASSAKVSSLSVSGSLSATEVSASSAKVSSVVIKAGEPLSPTVMITGS